MKTNDLKEGDLVLATVDRITPTTIFAKLPDGKEATLIISEIAPGRIKNLREYVVPNKKIVCKVLRVQNGHIDISLRRVNSKEKKQVMEAFKQEQTIKSAFKQLLKEKAHETEEKIIEEFPSLSEFVLKAKEDNEIISKYIPKEFLEQILKIINKKQKEIEVKKIIKLKCLEPNGIAIIKKIMNIQQGKIVYLAAGKFQITVKSEDYKKANLIMEDLIKQIEISAKENKCDFEMEDKK